MRLLILFLLLNFHIYLYSQNTTYYSNIYYDPPKMQTGKVDINANIIQNVNANIHVSGYINEQKHITTIDFGALELANVQREQNRMEQQIYVDAREKEIATSIAIDPVKAYEYGYKNKYCMEDIRKFDKDLAKSMTKNTGIKDFCSFFVIPNDKLFSSIGPGKYQNISDDGVLVDITFNMPNFYIGKQVNLDSISKFENINIGKGPNGVFYHKKDKRLADVFGTQGLRSTLAMENNYEYIITDLYTSYNYNHKVYFIIDVQVRYHGDKRDVTFEQLEGRRYYFRNLIQKLIATGYVENVKN